MRNYQSWKNERSRLQWLQEGEKPSKYLSSLENKNFIEKTIKKVRLNSGNVVTEQEEVLHQVQLFYVNLFENKDDQLQNTDFEMFGITSDIKVKDEDIGTILKVDEIGLVLKKMKPNKTPGIGGITPSFSRYFSTNWNTSL